MNKFKQWMVGRYGIDMLGSALLYVALGISIFNLFFNSLILGLLSFLLVVLMIYRMTSKDFGKRRAENQKFLAFYGPLFQKIAKKVAELKGLKDYKYFRCPSCSQKLRIPRRKGKVTITCPKCKTQFQGKA